MGRKKNVHSAAIESAAQAQKQSDKLESIWSQESILTQRILIYMAKLLEMGLGNETLEEQIERVAIRVVSEWIPVYDPQTSTLKFRQVDDQGRDFFVSVRVENVEMSNVEIRAGVASGQPLVS